MGPFVPAGSSTSPQQKLWLQKSFGSGSRRTTFQSLTTGCHDLPASAEYSILYAAGAGGAPDDCQLAANRCTGFSPCGAANSSVAVFDPIAPSTRCASACALLGPALARARPEARNVTWFSPSCSRGMIATLHWQTVRQDSPADFSASAPAPNRNRYWL